MLVFLVRARQVVCLQSAPERGSSKHGQEKCYVRSHFKILPTAGLCLNDAGGVHYVHTGLKNKN